MAHLWVRDNAGTFVEMPADGAVVTLVPEPPFVRPGHPGSDPPSGPPVQLQRALSASGDLWVVISRPEAGVLVNGAAVPAGIRVLDTRDEIRWSSGRLFVFSNERLARVEPFPDAGARVRCGRCTAPIAASTPAVRCPSCGSWYHQFGEFPCWTSAPFCQVCSQATELMGDCRWTPEDH
jgi:hypothetical protein